MSGEEARAGEPPAVGPTCAPCAGPLPGTGAASGSGPAGWRAAPLGDVRRLLISGGLLAAGWLTGLLAPAPPWLAAVLYAATIAVGGHPTARKALRALRRRQVDFNVLMTVAVSGAMALGDWREGAVVAFLYNVAEALETYALDRARGAIRALMDLAPKVARVRRDGTEVTVPVEAVAPGDVVIVRPGERIAVDGRVLQGASAVNQAAITGESVPVDKGPGDEVFAGTLNGEGALEVEVTRRVADTTLARIIHLVEEAQAQRAPSQRLVDRFARYYTPAVAALAAGVALVPPLLLGQPWSPWLYEGLALLVASCPCALVVSTPVALVSAIGSAARHGVLVKGGLHLETAARLQAAAFDKTGTLTEGRPTVTDVVRLGGNGACPLCLAGSLERRSEHPLARAIVAAAEAAEHDCAPPPDVEGFRALPGRGATAVIDGTRYYIGNPRLFAELGLDTAPAAEVVARFQEEGKTAILLGTDTEVAAVFAVADALRPASVAALRELRQSGVEHVVMLTGDNARTAQAVARRAGIPEFRAELLPEDKVTAVKELRRRYGAVAMVGDGVNDAPALAAATLGVAMGGAGTDVALETADVVLMADDLSRLPFLVRLSRATLGVIRQNVTLSLGLKLAAVAAVVPGWLTLWLAILADMGATVLVTLNAARLLRYRPLPAPGTLKP